MSRLIGVVPQGQGAFLFHREALKLMRPTDQVPDMFAPIQIMNKGKFKMVTVVTPDTILQSGAGKCGLNETDFSRENKERDVVHCIYDLYKTYCKEDFDYAPDKIDGIAPEQWMTESIQMLAATPAEFTFFIVEVDAIKLALANDYVRISWSATPNYPVGSTNPAVTAGNVSTSRYLVAPHYYNLNVVPARNLAKVNKWLNGYINQKNHKVKGIFRCEGYLAKMKAIAEVPAAADADNDLILIDTNDGTSARNIYNHEQILGILREMYQANTKLNDPHQEDAPFFVLPDSIFVVFREAMAALGFGTEIPYLTAQTAVTPMNGATKDWGWLDGFRVWRYSAFDRLAKEMGATFSATINSRQRYINRNALVLFMKPRSLQPFADVIGTAIAGAQPSDLNFYQPGGSAADLMLFEIFGKYAFAFDFPDPNAIVVGWASDPTAFA